MASQTVSYEDLQDMDELYDLEADPYEVNNIITDDGSAELVIALNAELNRLIEISSR